MKETTQAAIRMAVAEDAAAILAIYRPFITDTAITFVSTLPMVDDIARKMADIQTHYPYLVCDLDGQVVGFAYANWVRPHEPYRWNAELSIYVSPDHHGRGIATALYTALLQILKIQGFCNLYAVITLPNDASIALHRRFGFKELAVHEADGYKLGAWRDVLWMQHRIEGASDPGAHGFPTRLAKVRANDIDTALGIATALMNGAR
ncbi:MAG: GNAT family N-acetyltransferase [Coriobacteriales bacterium]|jgi:phosphinothricin acetyltransferase|nr:GNAT family N-acetyltransferase [Coriobacteriales bacterium]